MLRKSSAHGHLAVESLEDRQLLAGDVSVTVNGGNLLIRGDAEDNVIAITAGEDPGQFVIAGFDDSNGDPTSIEGVENGELVVDGVTGNLFVGLGGGDDSLFLTDAELPRNVVVFAGTGNDFVLVGQGPQPLDPEPTPEVALDAPLPEIPIDTGPVHVAGNLVLQFGPGDDRLEQHAVRVGRNEVVQMGLGDDIARLGLGPAIVPDEPTDTADLPPDRPLGVAVQGNLSVQLGAGNNGFAARHLHVGRNLHVGGYNGEDRIALVDATIGHLAFVHTGGGADNVVLNGVEARYALINTGAADDRVRITDSVFGGLGVLLGSGDDHVAVGGTSVRWLAFFDGGPGTDTGENLGGNSFGNLIRIRFENEPEPDEA